MLSSKERVFVIGATGDVGSGVVIGLVKKRVHTTAYVRNEQKAKDLFKDELNTDYLTLVIGTYSSIEIYKKAIQGHTRLFLLVADVMNKPASMSQIKETLGKIAFEKGVRQIVDLSSASVGNSGKEGIIGYMHITAEEKLWTLADENPEERSLVVLRPAAFMTNHFMGDIHNVKRLDTLFSCAFPSSVTTWIDTADISDCAVVILTESVEKHDRNAYELAAETLTNEQRAAIFSKVLGRSIKFEQQSIEEFYKTYTSFGMSHSLVYNWISYLLNDICKFTTPQIALLLGRPLHTFEEWLRENAHAFE